MHIEFRAHAGPRTEQLRALGLYKSVVLVLYLLRQNPIQQAAAELFGISQSTVSRRWTTLLPVVKKTLAAHVPDPAKASAGRSYWSMAR
ncbi:transposase family protein [Streptomyces sp. NBC_01092]|uniref:helix-turn-helix domain-containing protein n=1 Tax=Streptomyces sp. NBC_01092 TaxID=2903748 RepID=UPI00386DEAC9|nr:transposase family protein [Streptomyces sp. NBC_01092]WSU55748.1 transposase family protein [Streptomyces sp. NBC_01092]